MSVITSVTAQNSVGVSGIYDLPADFVARQIDAVIEDFGAHALKTGMLSNRAIIAAVADRITHYKIENFVLDPVMVAQSGDRLIRDRAVAALKKLLIPLALVITPNLDEATCLVGFEVKDLEAMKAAAQSIHKLGADYVIVKGGHLAGAAIDVLYDGHCFERLSAPRVKTKDTHGSGCTFASAIAAELAKGKDVKAAARSAKIYVTHAIRHALRLGRGPGALGHFYRFW
jgi:hydroxymethylpyrimidine/phosphomethylpyrimidine kinase